MPAGIEVFNETGVKQFDIGSRLLRVLVPNFSTSSGASSVVVPNQGTVVAAMEGEAGSGGSTDVGQMTVTGTTVAWSAGRTQEGSILVF